jgi:hypothetical protein
VLHDKGTTFAGQDPSLHNLGGQHSLFRIEISRWLINQEDIAWLSKSEYNSDSLKLSSGESLHIIIKERFNLQRNENLGFEN